jgi:radical SAM superfamily enzyme YgiQ (UPF0313 family)
MNENGINVEYIHEKSFSKALIRIKQINPAILLYTAFSAHINAFIEFDKIVKKNINVKSIIGGHGATYEREKIMNSTIDVLCVGEGEYAIVEYILNDICCHKNIICNSKENVHLDEYYPFVELDSLPFPNRDIVYKDDHILRLMPSKQFLSGRGCPFKCTYCFNHVFNETFKEGGPVVRKKSVDYLINEILNVKEKHPLSNVVFQDDTFILNRKWLFEFCERFPKEVGITYTCNVRANLIDVDIVRALKESKCVCVFWSIESGNEFLRNKVLKRHMSKEQILKAAWLLNKYKIPHRTANLIGLPGEKYEEMLETLELNILANPEMGQANIFVPFPGLELTNYAKKNNYLPDESANNLPLNFFTRSSLKITSEENNRIQKLMCLFPILAKYPSLFHNTKIFNTLLEVPKFLLRIIYELYSAYKLSTLYKVKTSFGLKVFIIIRYVKNI